MELCLIHADHELNELQELTDFDSFSAVISLGSSPDCDWELTLPSGAWKRCPIEAGHYICIEGTEWGGPVERVRHISTERQIKLQGTCWRGLLQRRIIAPEAGQTHVVLVDTEANSAIAQLLDGWQPRLFTADTADSGLRCSGSLRYAPLLEALDDLLEKAGGRLSAVFSGGRVTLSAHPSRDMSDQVELSQEYDARLQTDSSSRLYNHVIALGSGEMLERQVVELWMQPDGSITDSAEAAGTETPSTLLYDYPAVESIDDLKTSARRKLQSYAAQSSMEIEMTEDIGLELTDRASVRDALTGMAASLKVVSRELTITPSGITVIHRLG